MANTATDLYLKKLRQKYKEKGATEQEAETMASQNTAQKEAQATTVNAKDLNGWQKFGAGVEEFVDNMAQTFLDLGEGLVDSVAIGVGSIAEKSGDSNTANKIRGFVERDWSDELVNQGNAFNTGKDMWSWVNFPSELLFGSKAREYSRQQDLLPDVVDSISSGIGSSLGMGALSSIPAVGWALTGMAAGGASAEQELKNNPDLDITSAMGYGIINGSVEVASELLVGKMLGLLGKGINKIAGGSAVSETATRFGLGSSTGGNILTNLIKEFNEEGIEEVASELVDPIARKLTIDKDKSWEDTFGDSWGNREYWINDVWTSYWQGGLSAVVMGGVGATANAIKVGGVRNYNAVLQVKQVAEINEQIKELESKNTDGKYNARIEALTAQKENVINNFQKNFEEYAKEYLRAQNNETLTNKEARKASIGEQMNVEQNRNVRAELALESALEGGATNVTFKDRENSADKVKNTIIYDGKELSTKEWVKTVIHEIGHINTKDFSFVDSILQDMNAQDLQNEVNKYQRRYKEAYTIKDIRSSDYYKEELKNGTSEVEAIKKAREKIIKEEIAMDRLASMFDNINEFKQAISGEKLSLLERLKQRFSDAYHHVEKAKKPKNYDAIMKTLREAINETKQSSSTGEDKRYIITDEQWNKVSKEDRTEIKERFGENINVRYTYTLFNELQNELNKIDKNGEYEDLEKASKAKMALRMLNAYREYSENLSLEFEEVINDLEEARNNKNKDEFASLYLKYNSLMALAKDAMEQADIINEEVDREGDYENYTDRIAEANEQRIEEAQEIVNEILDNLETYVDDAIEGFEDYVEEVTKETPTVEEKPVDTTPLTERDIKLLTFAKSKIKQVIILASSQNNAEVVNRLNVIDALFDKPENLTKGQFEQLKNEITEIQNKLMEVQNGTNENAEAVQQRGQGIVEQNGREISEPRRDISETNAGQDRRGQKDSRGTLQSGKRIGEEISQARYKELKDKWTSSLDNTSVERKSGRLLASRVRGMDGGANNRLLLRANNVIGRYIRSIKAYNLQTIGDTAYKVVDINILPDYFKDLSNELSKLKTADGSQISVYFYVEDDINNRNGFSDYDDNAIAININSTSPNTAFHELSHHLRALGSKSYSTAVNELLNYSKNENYAKNYNSLYKKIEDTYSKKNRVKYSQSYYRTNYEDLSNADKKRIDDKVLDKNVEELLCAVTQGKYLLQDRQFQKDLTKLYMDSIKKEYGIDLSKFYFTPTYTLSEAITPGEIDFVNYTPILPIEITNKNELKPTLELISKYYDKVNEEIKNIQNLYTEKVINASDILQANTERKSILESAKSVENYINNIENCISLLNKNYAKEVKETLGKQFSQCRYDFTQLKQTLKQKILDSNKNAESVIAGATKTIENIRKELMARIDKEITNYNIIKKSATYEALQNLKDTFKVTLDYTIRSKEFDFSLEQKLNQQIDDVLAGYYTELNEAVENLKALKEKEKSEAKITDEKKSHKTYTYDKTVEKIQLQKLRDNLSKEITDWQNANTEFNDKNKSMVSRFRSNEIKSKQKLTLLERVTNHINNTLSLREKLLNKLDALRGNDIYRLVPYNATLGNTITSLENKLGSPSEIGMDTWYGIKNTLEIQLGIYNQNKNFEQLSKEFDEKFNSESANTKKEIKSALSEMERKIPNEIEDNIEALEDKKDAVEELIKTSEENSEENKQLKELVEKLKKNLANARRQLTNAKAEAKTKIQLWKSKYIESEAAFKDLLKTSVEIREKYLEAKNATDITETEEYINLTKENKKLEKQIASLEKKIKQQKEVSEEAKKQLAEKKAEYTEKSKEAKKLANQVLALRKKLVLQQVNGKSMIKIDSNFYKLMNELLSSLHKDVKIKGDFFSYQAMQRFALAFDNNDASEFAQAVIDELEAKGYDNELQALENGADLYYETNFTDLLENVFNEIYDYQNSEFTNVGKLMIRLENAKTDYKLLKETYKTNLRTRTASAKVKAFVNFFGKNTKNTSSRLNGVDEAFRESLVNFVENLRNESTVDDVANGTLRRNIISFFNELNKKYNNNIEVNGIALDTGILDMVSYLQSEENEYKKYIEDLKNTAEFNEQQYRNSYKISDTEAKIYRELFNGLKRFTDDVMHNRYWEVGDVTMKGVAFTRKLVNEVEDLKNSIKQLKWKPLSKMYISPRNIFREISGYKDNSLVMELYKELEKGTIRTMEAKMDLAKPLQEFFNKNKKLAKELQTDSEKYYHTIRFGAKKSITASTTVLLDLYEDLQNANNKAHIMNDGIEVKGLKKRILKFEKFSELEIETLEKELVKEFNLDSNSSAYSQYLDLLSTMYEKAKKYKISTDIRARGFTNVQDGFYYPTNVSDFNLDIDLSSGAFNMGNTYGGVDLVTTERSFNKALQSTRGAVNLVNSYEKMLQHINGMADYYGVDTSILNFSKIYRYRVEGGISNGNIIRQLYGADYKNFDKYLGELFKDMRGTNNPSTGTDAYIKKIEKTVRSGVVTATLVNPKVIATQPASLITAFKYISPKHVISSLNNFGRLSDKYPSLPTVGAYRYFDQSALQAETGGVDNNVQKFLGKGISSSDHGAINVLWVACCKQEGLLQYEKGSVEYNEALKKATDLFTRVVNDTQPNNSALGKAEIMRSDNEVVKLFTMYRSQAMQNFNIVYDAINQYRLLKKIANAKKLSYQERKILLSKPKKELARALASLILEGALFTFIGQLFSHFVNNDWDDEDFWEHAVQDYSIQYFNDNILGIMPILNKLEVELEDNLSVSFDNITMGWLENVVESIQKLAEGPSPKKFIQIFSYATGIPVATNYKYTKAIIQYIAPEFAYEFDAIYNGTNTKSKTTINYALNDKQYDKAYELYKKYTSYSMEFDLETTKEMFNLYKLGYTDVAVKPIPASITYNGKSISVDTKQFKDIYSMVAKKINQLTKSSAYKNLTADKKADAIKYLLDMYYSLARKKFTEQKLSFAENILINDMNLSVDKLLLIREIKDIDADENLTKKEKTQQYINNLKTNKAYKYFLYMASGYSLSDEQKRFVKSYLVNNGLSWKKASAIL